MGKKLRQQRRGKGSNLYRKLPNTFDISVSYDISPEKSTTAEVVDIFNHPGHTAPLMCLMYENFDRSFAIAPEGIKIGDKIYAGPDAKPTLGSILELKDIPEGIPIYNLEATAGDGGKLVRSAGTFAIITSKSSTGATVQLPSKSTTTLNLRCRAQLGMTAGGGITDQPIVKAGKSHYMYHVLNTTWPRNRGVKMNPVDHPFGGKQHHKGKSSMTSRNAPPGRKVGHIAARRVGRKKK
ncbi:50S ribosomal protein L2 [Candidatus Marsarchaeota archaeon]|nr:50S ribosomal protein L2 [Candidatus Marsarchaeota archaeon]MCL5404856.1 50S ribosomal protein L2 [Candidatus Marsarchaeota archaeon]